jgi:hypothetical protein
MARLIANVMVDVRVGTNLTLAFYHGCLRLSAAVPSKFLPLYPTFAPHPQDSTPTFTSPTAVPSKFSPLHSSVFGTDGTL